MLRAIGDFVTGLRSGIRADADDNPLDERWWSTSSYVSATGITVTPTLAFQVSCFLQGVRLYAETIGTLPLHFYRARAEGGRERLHDYWLDPVLDTRDGQANPWQTAQQFRELMTARSVAWGDAIAEIKPGTEGRAVDLWPLDPDRIVIEQVATGRIRVKVTRDDGRPDTLPQDRVLRVQGFSVHRFCGTDLMALGRETIGLWLAVENYNATYFRQGARPSLFLEHPAKPDDKTMDRLREQVRRWQGLKNMHRVLIGEQGMKPHALGWSAKDSLLPEQKQEIARDVARLLGLPATALGVGEPNRATAEQYARELIDYSLRPMAVRWEAAYSRDLIRREEGDKEYCEHNFDALLRAHARDRSEVYASGIMNGWLSEKENLNPVEGLDEPRRSVNQDRGGDPRQQRPAQAPPPPPPPSRRRRRDEDEDEEEASAPRRVQLIARGAARRVVHRELTAVKREAEKLASKPASWEPWLAEFYGGHGLYVAEALELELSLARGYAERHRAALAAGGLAAAENWDTEAVDELTALTLEETDHAA
jgi:HK97 family phage portal protein